MDSHITAPAVETDEHGRKIVPFNASPVTIGIELEMIIHNLPTHLDHFQLLKDALIPLAPSHSHTFEIKDDFSITSGPTGLRAEVSTPIMRTTGPQSYHHIIPSFCAAIRSAVPPPASIEFNSSTALQVHIGVGDGNTYALKDVKRICKAIVIFESRMDTLHPRCRNPADDASPNFLRRCGASFKLKLLDDAKKLELIDRQTSVQGLVMVVNSAVNMRELPTYYKYNFRSLGKFGTIEFRQAIGTVRSEVVVGWVEVVVRFVTAAVETEDRVYGGWAEGGTVSDGDCERFGVPFGQGGLDMDAYWGVKDE